MKKLPFALAFMTVFVTMAVSQVPAPRPTPPDAEVVKISTNLIQIDVSVTDKKGKPVSDLRTDEIEIYENGVKQKITNFSFISSVREVAEKPAAIDSGLPTPPSFLRPEQIRRTIALVVDDLSLSFESAYQVRRTLKKYVDEQMQPGDLVAIIRTGAGIGALQQFTSDKRLLYAAINKVVWNPMGSGGVSAFAPIEPTPLESLSQAGDTSITAEDIEAERNAINAQNDYRNSLFSTGTLGALSYVVNGMSVLPGRKSVVLFSDGFKLYETDRDGMRSSGDVLKGLQQLIDTANRSSVVFYTIDPRGLQYTGFTAADQITDTSPEAMNARMSERRDQLLDTQEGLSYLAAETGGIAIKNNNDLSGGVRRVLDDQSYYLVGYEPDSDTFDPASRKFNQLTVKVLRKDVNVRYRSGFFNVATGEKPAVSPALSPGQQLQAALVSPFAVNEINLRLNALFGSDSKNMSFVRSLLHVNASDLKFTDEKDGTKKAVFDVLAISFGDNGQIVDQLGKSYTLTLKPEAYKRIIEEGFVYHFAFPVKKPGAYQYRVALRDSQAGRVGSASQFIEVPDVKKGRLILSSVVIENVSMVDWQKMASPDYSGRASDSMSDTAQRRIKSGSVLRYGLEIYNAKLNSLKRPSIKIKVRVFRDGAMILDGTPREPDLAGQSDMLHVRYSGAIGIGAKMEPGDYVLQVIVTDELAKKKQQIAAQFVQFEVVP